MQINLPNRVIRDIRTFAEDNAVKKVVLFGSRARGDNQPKSDIDIAVYGCNDFAGFTDQLNEELWSLLQLDIINMDDDNISERLLEEIERDGVELYAEV